MMKSNEYLDAVKKELNIDSETDLATVLQTKKQNIYQIRKGKAGVRGGMILRISKLLNLPIELITFEMLAEREINPEDKKEFLKIAKKFTRQSVNMILIIMLSFSMYPVDSKANILNNSFNNLSYLYIHYTQLLKQFLMKIHRLTNLKFYNQIAY